MNVIQPTSSLTLTHWGAYEVDSVGGSVRTVRPFHDDPEPSPIEYSMVDVERCRVRMPSVRESCSRVDQALRLSCGEGSGSSRSDGISPSTLWLQNLIA